MESEVKKNILFYNISLKSYVIKKGIAFFLNLSCMGLSQELYTHTRVIIDLIIIYRS